MIISPTRVQPWYDDVQEITAVLIQASGRGKLPKPSLSGEVGILSAGGHGIRTRNNVSTVAQQLGLVLLRPLPMYGLYDLTAACSVCTCICATRHE